MFTLEILGTPIAVTKGNESEARAAFEDPEFKRRLLLMESDGKPLWNGTDPLKVRRATPAEVHAIVQYAERMGLEDEQEGEIILYLQPVDTAEDVDETQDG